MRLVKALSAAVVLSSMLAAPALGATCNAPGGFNAFLTEFKKDAAAQGVSRKGLSALDGLTLDDSVLAADKLARIYGIAPCDWQAALDRVLATLIDTMQPA